MKKIFKHDLALTQRGEIAWKQAKESIRVLFSDHSECNPIELRQLLSSALILESSKRITNHRRAHNISIRSGEHL
jgi:hypothetical protein